MKLTVNLPKNPYDIIIQKDSLAQVGDWVKDLWKPQKIAIITDDHVSSLYLETVKTSLEKAGFESIAPKEKAPKIWKPSTKPMNFWSRRT